MKTITMLRDFDYHANRWITIAYKSGETYRKVPEAAVRAILAAKAGEVEAVTAAAMMELKAAAQKNASDG